MDRDDRRQDPDRAAAIKDTPNSIATLQSFLGLANYYQLFIPNMQDLRAPLNELLKKKTNFGCGQRNANRNLKKISIF